MSVQMAPRIASIQPILDVRDVAAATAFYRDVLDFEHVWLWGDPPNHGGAIRDGAQVQFSLNPDHDPATNSRGVWVQVRNVAALYGLHQDRRVTILSTLEGKPWNVSEYTVRDLDGYRLRFAGSDSREPSAADLPPGVRIESRAPTWLEYERLIYAVGWQGGTNFEVAPKALEAAVAAAAAAVDEEVIGCALLTTDGAGMYYVRDVMVHPSWQHGGIGTALLRELMAYVEANAPPRSLVTLFTGSNLDGFYGQFGFRGPDRGLYGMTYVVR